MATRADLREQIADAISELPDARLTEVRRFLEFLRFEDTDEGDASVVVLEGILDGYRFSEEEIAQARCEMWRGVDSVSS